jgi:3-isopropylmalate/(R)-2-methylmalate dehydratase large subunit
LSVVDNLRLRRQLAYKDNREDAVAMPSFFDKIWHSHTVGERADGRTLVYIDRHVIHDLHAPPAFAKLRKSGRAVRRPDLTVAVTDHMVATSPGRTDATIAESAPFLARTRAGGAELGIPVLGIGNPLQGIVHVISPELAIALPGSTIACPDSHACTVGGIGALGLATGTTELVHVLATQTLAWKRPKQMRITLQGALAPDVTAKDVILHVIGHWGSDMARGHAVEFAGPVARNMPVEGRMTLCNMVTELGGRTGLVAPDETVAAWLQGRACAPQGPEWNAAVAEWAQLFSDDDAVFDQDLSLDCSTLEPQITWGIDPAHVIGLSGRIPDPADAPAGERDALCRALDYMQLQPGTPIAGLPIDRVFIGSCTNARLSDLQSAAAVAAGGHVAAGVRATVVPGSSTVKRAAEAQGLDRIFLDAGFEWGEAGCSMCAGVNGEEGSPGQRIVSTTNRNFAGRQGAGVMTHLASPATAAAAALAGCITDRRVA